MRCNKQDDAVPDRIHLKPLRLLFHLTKSHCKLDAAVNPRIAAKKAPADSQVAGCANVLITPDINSGNILYKSLEQFAGAKLAGPILLGFKAPVSDLSRGSTVEDIEFTTECLVKLAK